MKELPSAARRCALGLLLILLVLGPVSPAPAQQGRPQPPASTPGTSPGIAPGTSPGTAAGILVADADSPPAPTPILPLDQVRIGMKGYGMTVFHGTTIEPFPVEVVSVMNDFAPLHPVIWIRCTDERMQRSGAVQGMSGSPIYLWGPAETPTLGKGGKLIGAFAFGYGGTLDCYVGVQPIEFMREVAQHVDPNKKTTVADAGDQVTAGAGSATPVANMSLRALLRSPAVAAMPDRVAWRARAIDKLISTPAEHAAGTPAATPFAVAAPPALGGHAQRLLLPLNVGSARACAILSPMLEPLGLLAMDGQVSGGGSGGGSGSGGGGGEAAGRGAPPGIDANAIRLEPGSVLAIPLAWGDMDLSAAGTVTDVLPDGRVLAFGHAMFGQGPLAVPMATGFVHMVMPSRQISFKLANSALIKGSVVRDENSGIVGINATRFASAPARIVINFPNQKKSEYNYQIVHQKMLTPVLATAVSIESLIARQNPPIENTAHITGSLVFAGDRTIHLDLVAPDLSQENIVLQILPPIAAMIQNQHESMMLESMDINIDVEPVLRVGSIVNARMDRSQIAPGETARLTVRIQPYGKPAFDRRVELPIPESLPEGDYQLVVCDAPNYLQTLIADRPHLTTTTNANELFEMVQKIVGIAGDAVYVVLQEKQEGLVIGRQEMPNLPSSRKALIASPNSTLATPYSESVEKIVPVGLVTEGNLDFTLTLKKKLTRE